METPAALVDLDILAQNIDRMAEYSALHGLSLRPHVKTHKSPRIAAEQLRLGAVGLTCATPRELEVMSDVTSDLLLNYPLLGAPKLARALSLPREVQLTVAVDSMIAVDALAATARIMDRPVRVYVELDLGMHRVGVQSVDDAIALAMRVAEQPPLIFAGITFYPGHIREPVSEQEAKLARLRHDLASALERMERSGVRPSIVSGGSTPLAWRMHEVPGVTEVRPGTYVYNDRTTAQIGACAWEDCAFTVLATVVSTAVPGQAVIDAGCKALGREPVRGVAGEGYAALLDRPEVTVQRMSEEHGILDLTQTSWRPRVGDVVRLVPNHVCIVVHLNDVIHGVRGDVVESRWPVSARGREGALAGDA
ncbi:MAG: alanine racemase [Gemmatimonadetes bacterium]|jgi:D-serine deaminase-like pyridoxal phosphate-dependent protein|nr:alanine racemase [Gemmatimonadota bacterium]MBK6844115.1 alanine racemase [Gemmatimonadota bacterium]MBK7834019.1 alanine racemase [Gemmatimonadota bacterium]MBK9980770.1 alanine racemase [Gemmatimonadota bacterium]MBP9106730.1 alanine racemase [Gemmatimonadaceae bacterium]